MNILMTNLGVSIVGCRNVDECRDFLSDSGPEETFEAFVSHENEFVDALEAIVGINSEVENSARHQLEELLTQVYRAGVAQGRNRSGE